jgi:Flp pilus assembly protein TadG
MNSQVKRRRSQRQARLERKSGVVMVEALIAISMIIVMFGGVVYFHDAYGAKARVLREARVQAWRATAPACDGDGKGIAAKLAPVPINYAAANGPLLSVTANAEMKCNERHDNRTTVTGVLAWSGLTKQLGNFGSMLLEAFEF